MSKIKDIVSNAIRRWVLHERENKTFYVMKYTLSSGETVLCPVMDHENNLTHQAGLRSRVMVREVIDFTVIGQGSEEDMLDLYDYEYSKFNEALKSNLNSAFNIK